MIKGNEDLMNKRFSDIAIAAVAYAIQAAIDLAICDDARVVELRELERRLVTKLQAPLLSLWTHYLSCAFEHLVRTTAPAFFAPDFRFAALADVIGAERAQTNASVGQTFRPAKELNRDVRSVRRNLERTAYRLEVGDGGKSTLAHERAAIAYAAAKLEETGEAGTTAAVRLLLGQISEDLT